MRIALSGTESRMAEFMELAATAIANAQTEQKLRELADTRASLRRLAMLIARGAPPEAVFAAVTKEVLQHFGSGTARMIRYGIDGTATLVANEGACFIPRAYPHHIEVVDAPEWHFLIFFDQPTPGDIGYRASASAYSREVLAATFDTHIDDLPNFPFTPADPLIVTRNNPVDKHGIGKR